MKFVQRFGVVVAAVMALLGMCRPASANETIFSFSLTAQTLESIFDSTPGFGGGDCYLDGQVSTLQGCGIYNFSLTPNVSNVQMLSISSPVSDWTAVYQSSSNHADCSVNCDTAYWYSNFRAEGSPVSLLTDNAGVNGKTVALFEGESPYDFVTPLTGSQLSSGDAFNFKFETTQTVSTPITFTLFAALAPLDQDGNQTDKGAVFSENDFTAPEPSGAWLCVAGIAVLGLRKKRRWLAARWNRLT